MVIVWSGFIILNVSLKMYGHGLIPAAFVFLAMLCLQMIA